MLFFCLDTSLQSFPPRAYCLVNHGLFECSSYLPQSLHQMRQITYWFFVHTRLHATPNFLVDEAEVRICLVATTLEK
jgi:hypothetical protein